MKFKVGDRVRIRQWDDMEKEFGLDSGCWIRYKVFENCESDCPTVIESEE